MAFYAIWHHYIAFCRELQHKFQRYITSPNGIRGGVLCAFYLKPKITDAVAEDMGAERSNRNAGHANMLQTAENGVKSAKNFIAAPPWWAMAEQGTAIKSK